MAFLLTTTGLTPTIIFSDLDNHIFTHPTTDYNLEAVFPIANISASEDLGLAIDNYEVTCSYNNVPIISRLHLKSINQNSATTVASYTGLLKVVNNVILGNGSVTDLVGFPSQTGNAGEFLTTDGSVLSWGTVAWGVITGTLSNQTDLVVMEVFIIYIIQDQEEEEAMLLQL